MKKSLNFLGGLVLSLMLLWACGNKEVEVTGVAHSDANVPGWQVDTSPVTLDWYINFAWFNFEFGKDLVSKKITEDTGVTINYVKPAGPPAEKLNTMIASDNLPDLITLGWWEAQVPQMIEAKMAWALDELADKYDPYFMKVANPQRLGWYEQTDGHVYGYPNSSYTPSDLAKITKIASNYTFEVRKDIWEAIGSPSMRTPEEFIAALAAAKKMFPEVDGQPLIPLGLHEDSGGNNLSLMEMLPDFLAIPREVDNKFYDRLGDPEYKRWLKTLNEVYREGLLSDDVFIDNRAQIEEKITQGRYFAMVYQRTDFIRPQSELFKRNPEQIYIAIDGPANSQLDDPTLKGPGINGWCLTLISKKSKHPDRAIRLMSYLMSPKGQKLTYLGVEGETWTGAEGEEQLLPEIAKLVDTDRTTFDAKYGALFSHWMLMDNAYALPRWEKEPQSPQKELVEWGYGKAISTSAYDDTNPVPGSREERMVAEISRIQGKAFAKLLRAKSADEFEQVWEGLQEERKKAGLEKILEYRTERMLENEKKLN